MLGYVEPKGLLSLMSADTSSCSMFLLPASAGWVVALVVVPGVLIAITAILWLLKKRAYTTSNYWRMDQQCCYNH